MGLLASETHAQLLYYVSSQLTSTTPPPPAVVYLHSTRKMSPCKWSIVTHFSHLSAHDKTTNKCIYKQTLQQSNHNKLIQGRIF